MYLSIDLKEFDKRRNSMIKEALDQDPENKNVAVYANGQDPSDNDNVEDLEFSNGQLNFSISNKLGWFGGDLELSDEVCMEIVEYMKSKGERIRRLIKLAETE